MKVKILIALLAALLLTGCHETRTVACDGCGKPQPVEKGSNITDDWIIYCDECYTERFGEEGLVS